MYMVSISLSGTLLVSFAPRPFFLISYHRSLPFCARPTTSMTAPISSISFSSSWLGLGLGLGWGWG